MRRELNQVWEVEATLKAGSRHVYARRGFYFDEDQPEVGASDHFDAAKKLFGAVFGLYLPFYKTAHQGSRDGTITLPARIFTGIRWPERGLC